MKSKIESVYEQLIKLKVNNNISTTMESLFTAMPIYSYNKAKLNKEAENVIYYLGFYLCMLRSGADAFPVAAKYNEQSDVIMVPSCEHYGYISDYYYSLFHEIAKACIKGGRVGGWINPMPVKMEEMVFDLTAAVILKEIGILDVGAMNFIAIRMQASALDEGVVPLVLNVVKNIINWIEIHAEKGHAVSFEDEMLDFFEENKLDKIA